MSKRQKKIDKVINALPKAYWNSFVSFLNNSNFSKDKRLLSILRKKNPKAQNPPHAKPGLPEIQRHQLLLAFQQHVALLQVKEEPMLQDWLWARAASQSADPGLSQNAAALFLTKWSPKQAPPVDYAEILRLQALMEQIRRQLEAGELADCSQILPEARRSLQDLCLSIGNELDAAEAKVLATQPDPRPLQPPIFQPPPNEIPLWTSLQKAHRGDRQAQDQALQQFFEQFPTLPPPKSALIRRCLADLLVADCEAHFPGADQSMVAFMKASAAIGAFPRSISDQELLHCIRTAAEAGQVAITKPFLERISPEKASRSANLAEALLAYHANAWDSAEALLNQLMQSESHTLLHLSLRNQLMQLYFERHSTMAPKLIPSQLKVLRQYLGRRRDLPAPERQRQLLKIGAFQMLFRMDYSSSVHLKEKYKRRIMEEALQTPFLHNWKWLNVQLSRRGLIPPIPPPCPPDEPLQGAPGGKQAGHSK